MKTSVKYVIISDTETGGLPSKDRRAVFDVALLEVSCCVIDMELLEIIEEYDNLIKPDYKDNLILSCEALAVNGIELDVLESSGVALQQVYKDLKSLFVKYKNPRHKAILGGHNFDGFDFDFFKNLFEFAGDDIEKYVKWREDTLRYAYYANLEQSDYKLVTCCNEFGIDLVGAHRALNDTRATAKLFIEFVKRLRSVGSANTPGNKESFRSSFRYQIP